MRAWFFSSLQGYRIQGLPPDLVAGLTVAAMGIPGRLARRGSRGCRRGPGTMPVRPAHSPSPRSALIKQHRDVTGDAWNGRTLDRLTASHR
jgi:hypothetical protein